MQGGWRAPSPMAMGAATNVSCDGWPGGDASCVTYFTCACVYLYCLLGEKGPALVVSFRLCSAGLLSPLLLCHLLIVCMGPLAGYLCSSVISVCLSVVKDILACALLCVLWR